MTETTEKAQTPLEHIGRQLKEAREKKKFSLEHVAKVTRINVGILRDIEQGDMEHSPGPVFLRGFIRTYGEFMGMDGETLQKEIVAIPELQKTVDISNSAIIPTEIDRPIWQDQKYVFTFLLLILLGTGYFAYEYFNLRSTQFIQELQTSSTDQEIEEPETTSIQKEPSTASEEPAEQNSPESLVESDAENKISEESDNETEEQEITQSTETLPIVSTTYFSVSADPVSIESEPAESVIDPDLLTLSIKTTQAVWLNITVDGEDPIEISLESGEEYTLEAKERYALTVGNTKGVEVLLNGKPQLIDQQFDLLENWILDRSSLGNME
ncbi:MAG: helix-turn-helix domain-containing protein [SAR324 cluster bacterium]|nr:helix-turn-helix domain-containing protein [SAR324 cluster bacterium]